MKKWMWALLLCAALSSCGNKEELVFQADLTEATPTPTEVPVYPEPTDRPPLPTETPYEGMPEGYVSSKLTGLPISAEAAEKRPVAVVVNNIYHALPQSGIAQADILYEVLAEGDITRLVAVFQDFDAPKIGPVRSARDYFVHFALDYDAVFVHHGGSPSGYKRLKDLKIDRMDGMALEGIYYWRDRTYPAWHTQNAGKTRPMEHSSYTGSEEIKNAIAGQKMRDTLFEDSAIGYHFNPASRSSLTALSVPEERQTVAVVRVPFSKNYTRVFTYDPASGLYAVANGNGPHQDAETEETIGVANILIQQVSMRVISGDEAGRREVRTLGAGSGYLVTAGECTPVKWEKPDDRTPTRWTLADGSEMRLNPGKTWICVFQDNAAAIFEEANGGVIVQP